MFFRNIQQIEEEEREAKERTNLFNQKILDSIIDDNDEEFVDLITRNSEGNLNPNQHFSMTKYKFPELLDRKPTYASLCAFFGSEKCFTSLSTLCPDGILSSNFQETDDLGRSPIHFACAGGCLNIVRELYQSGYELNNRDKHGFLPSHYSAMFGTTDVLKYLWTKGLDVLNMNNRKFMSPLHFACLYGNIDIVKFLSEDVDFESKIEEDENVAYDYYHKSTTPLHLACEGGHSNIIEYFLLNKKNFVNKLINVFDFESRTPLVVACQNGNLSCVKLLINVGKTNFNPTKRKHSPLIDAAQSGHADIVEFLIKQKNVDINSTNSQKLTPLQIATLNGHSKVVEVLIKNGASDKLNSKEIGELFFMSCGTFSNDTIVLLDKMLKIPYEDMGDIFVKQACKIENVFLISFLVDRKCNLNCINADDINFNIKWKPFYTFLKEKGADFSELKTSSGVPVIVKTIKKGSIASVNEMINNGVKLTTEIINQYNLVEDACYHGDLTFFKYLLSFNPKILNVYVCLIKLLRKIDICSSKYTKQHTMDNLYQMFEILLKEFEFNQKQWDMLVDFTANKCLMKCLELLSNHDAEINHCAVDYDEFIKRNPYLVIEFLIKKGVDINNITTKDKNPLIVKPIQKCDLKFVDFLISNGAKLDNETIEKFDLINQICEKGNLELFNTMMKIKPIIKDPTFCLELTLNIKFKNIILNDPSALNSRLTIAEILLNDYKANPNNNKVIEFAASYCIFEILELFAKYGADFNEIDFDYSEMVSENHIPVFDFLESHGCEFKKQKQIEYFDGHRRNFFALNFDKNDSPLMINLKRINLNIYDVRTLLFLIKHTSNDEIMNLRTTTNMAHKNQKCIYLPDGEKNIIDILFYFACFNGIFDVYKKLNTVVLPISIAEDEFKQAIRSCDCQELFDMLFNSQEINC